MLGGLGNRLLGGEKRSAQLSFPDYMRLWEQFGYNGVQYMVPSGGMAAMTAGLAARNPIIQACMMIRAQTFSEVTFKFRNKTTYELFGSPALSILENPWAQAKTGALLLRMEFDVSRFGNSYWWRKPDNTLVWLDPTKISILTGDVEGPSGATCGSQLLAYQLQDKAGKPIETFFAEDIVHYAPIPDSTHPFRGLSWLSALLPDITADQDLTDFKHAFLNNAATPNLVVSFAPNANMSKDGFQQFMDKMESKHTGPASAFKTLYVGPGADVKAVGSNFEQLQLTETQSLGEVRLCVAAGVPASILGIGEGLKGSALNAGNYSATRRRFSDMTIRPLWREVSAALETVCPPPPGAELWYDDSHVLFLQADNQDAAQTRQSDATTMMTLVNAGYDPATVTSAVKNGNWGDLKHTGLVSVQLQPPGLVALPKEGTTGDQPSGN